MVWPKYISNGWYYDSFPGSDAKYQVHLSQHLYPEPPRSTTTTNGSSISSSAAQAKPRWDICVEIAKKKSLKLVIYYKNKFFFLEKREGKSVLRLHNDSNKNIIILVLGWAVGVFRNTHHTSYNIILLT